MPRIASVNHQDAVRALKKMGFQIIRQGKHIVLTDCTRQVTIPRHNPIKAFTMGGIVQDAGLTPEEFRKLPAVEKSILMDAEVSKPSPNSRWRACSAFCTSRCQAHNESCWSASICQPSPRNRSKTPVSRRSS